MRFSSSVALSSIFALASATSHIQEVAVTCTDPAPSTVYQTVTVTSTVYGGNNNNQQYSSVHNNYNPSTTTHSTTTTATHPSKATHSVIVGANGDLVYSPNQLYANIGDIIRFDFNATNHTVTQSSFNAPCSPLAGGFNTGFNQFNKLNRTGVIFVDFEVKVDTPLWFYCAQTVKASHCNKGMVLGVNPAGKFPAFLSMATASSTATSTVTTAGTKVTTSVVMGTAPSTYSAKATATASKATYRVKGRQAAQWYN